MHCYVQDDDPGGSWVELKAILTHTHPKGSVDAALWNKQTKEFTLPESSVDEIVICEDGLWSGHEAIDRLKAIRSSGYDKKIKMKYGIVTDFGLKAVRHAIRNLGLNGSIEIDAYSSERESFLKPDTPNGVENEDSLSADDYYKRLHEWVEPLAFSRFEAGKTDLDHCRQIGRQLVTLWLAREKKEQSEANIDKYALGGGGFASTVMFARSIPKVCLPLFWLDGPVALNGRQVKWRPLFTDARRIGDTDLLYGGR